MLYKLPEIKKIKISLPKIEKRAPRIKKPKNWFSFVFLLSVFLSSGLGFVAGALATRYLLSDNQILLPDFNWPISLESQDGNEEDASLDSPVIISEEEAIVNVVKQASPAVVSIIVTKDLPVIETYYYNPFEEFEEFFGKDFGFEVPSQRQKGTEKREIGGGTGFIVSSDGLILTNKHVVLDETADYTVLTNEGEQFDAQVLARDPIQDIAILKVTVGKKLPVVKLGDSDKLQIGQTVIAIGNVLGEFRNSVSVGIVSGLRRSITASGGGFAEVLDDIIQTDAAINKGNSGGPLLNLKGEVIGINTAVALAAENVGFAIPVNKAKKDITQVQEFGEIRYPFLGIYYTLVTPALQEEYDLGVDYGAWVGHDRFGQETEVAVFPDSPAEEVGLQRSDIILEFDGQKIDLENTLARIINQYNPDDTVTLKLLRDGQEKILDVTLEKRAE